MFSKPNTTIDGLMEPGLEVPGDTGARVFLTSSGESFLGLQMGESKDSFLIFFPSRLLASGDKRLVEPFMMVPFFRALKATLSFIVPVYGELEYFYTEYLATRIPDLYPDFDNEFPGQIQCILEAYDKLRGTGDKTTKLVSLEEVKNSIAPTETDSGEEVVYVAPSSSKYKH